MSSRVSIFQLKGAHLISDLLSINRHAVAGQAVITHQAEVAAPEQAAVKEPSTEGRGCRICKTQFDTLSEQKSHFKSPEHVGRIQRQNAPDDEDASDSEFEPDHQEDDEASISQNLVVITMQTFTFSLYRALLPAVLPSGGSLLSAVAGHLSLLQDQHVSHPYWTILMLSGGYFAGCVYSTQTGKQVVHKTIRRYTVRRKQGGSQASRDSKGSGIKSVGAQIRRNNQVLLTDDVERLLVDWKEHLERSARVWIHCPGPHNRQILNPSDGTLSQLKDAQEVVRSIPITTYKPTLKELDRVFSVLSTVSLTQT